MQGLEAGDGDWVWEDTCPRREGRLLRASIHSAGVKQPTNISRLHSKDLGKLKWSLEVLWASCPVTSPVKLVETQRPGPHRCIESDSQEEGRAICVLKSPHRPCRDTARIENLSSKSSFNFRIWGVWGTFLTSDRLFWKQHDAGWERRLGTRSHRKPRGLDLRSVDSDGESGKETLKITDCHK